MLTTASPHNPPMTTVRGGAWLEPAHGGNVADLFLPESLRLDRHNWSKFVYAITTLLQLRGISLAHLDAISGTPSDLGLASLYRESPADKQENGRGNWYQEYEERVWEEGEVAEHPTAEEAAKLRARWLADDEMTKAILVLNVRSEFMCMAAYESQRWSISRKRVTAAEMWQTMKKHNYKRQQMSSRRLGWFMTTVQFLFLLTVIVYLAFAVGIVRVVKVGESDSA